MTGRFPVLKTPARWRVVVLILGLSTGLLLAGFSLESQPRQSHSAFVVEPQGRSWLLTPPSTWCNITQVAGGTEHSCSMAGAAWIPLNVTGRSRISGSLEVKGPSSVWVLPSVWACELEIQLTGFVHPCPAPFNPPPWGTWNTTFSSAVTINLSSLPINVTSDLGVLPVATWALVVVDEQATNETVTVTSPVVLEGP